MEKIRQLVDERFFLFNVNDKKAPINKKGHAMPKWIELSFEQLCQEHNWNSLLWGMKMGKHENGRFILSIDFDCCGKKNTLGERIGCQFTKDKLNEWKSQVQNFDGMYSSSTDGNANILIDYTNCPTIIQKVQQLNKTKFKIEELEVLLGGNQVIPPSSTISKITLEMGNPRQFLSNNMFYILTEQDIMYNYVLDLFPKEKIIVKKEKKEKPNLNEIITFEDIQDDKYLKLLFNVIGNRKLQDGTKQISHAQWFHICGMLKSNGYDKNIWLQYSQLVSTTNTASNLWDRLKCENYPLYGLQNIAKEINPIAYNNWLVEYRVFMPSKHLQSINDLALWITKKIKNDVIYCNNSWYVCNQGLWEIVEEPIAFFVTFIQNNLKESIKVVEKICELPTCENKESLEELITLYEFFYKNICENKNTSAIKKFLMVYLHDKDFYKKLNDGFYRMVFKNGIMDLRTLEFKEGITRDDFVSETIPWNWEKPSSDDIDTVIFNLKKICNWNQSHLDYYLSSIGYSFTSDSSKEQALWWFRGQTASNGKSVIFEALTKIFPNYVLRQENTVFDAGGDNRKKIARWPGIKLLWMNELSTKRKNEEMIKCICDGTEFDYDRLYSTESVTVNIQFKVFCCSQHSLNTKTDNGITRRLRVCQFDSHFSDEYTEDNFETLQFKVDKGFGNLLQNQYKFALAWIIMEYANKFYKEQKLMPYPIEWQDEKDEDIENSDDFKDWFEKNFELVENGYCHKDIFNELYKAEKLEGRPKDHFRRLKLNVSYDGYKRLIKEDLGYTGSKKQGFWIGFVLREE